MWFFQLKNQRCENLQHFCIKMSKNDLISSRNYYYFYLLLFYTFVCAYEFCLVFFWNFKKEGNINVKTQFCLRELIFHRFFTIFCVVKQKETYILIKLIISGRYSKWQNLNIFILSCYQSWFTQIKHEDATYFFLLKRFDPKVSIKQQRTSGRQTEARRQKRNNHVLPSWGSGRTGVLR